MCTVWQDAVEVAGWQWILLYTTERSGAATLLTKLLLRADSHSSADAVLPFARILATEQPGDAKRAVLHSLIGGDNALAVLLIPEIGGFLAIDEAETVLDRLASDSLRQFDPYVFSTLNDAHRAVADLLSRFPALLPRLVGRVASADASTRGRAADLVLSAIALGRRMTDAVAPELKPLLGGSLDDLGAELSAADNRYSVSDRPPRAHGIARSARIWASIARAAACTYAARLAIGIMGALALGVVALRLLAEDDLPQIGSAEVLTAAAVLIALHTLAAELAASRLPSGFVSLVAWPARLVCAYLAIAIAVVASVLVPQVAEDAVLEAWLAGAFLVFLLILPFVVPELIQKSEAHAAANRVARDRRLDMWRAGRRSGRAYSAAAVHAESIRTLPSIIQASVEPVRRRQARIAAPRDGHVEFDLRALSRLDGVLRSQPDSEGKAPPRATLLVHPGTGVHRGDTIGTLDADEPYVLGEPEKLMRRAIKVRRSRSVSRAQAGIRALNQLLLHQVRDGDFENAEATSRHHVDLIRMHLRGCSTTELREGYLGHVLPETPEQHAAEGWERAYGVALKADDDAAMEFLRKHALRLAGLAYEHAHSSCLEILLVRAGVLASSAAPNEIHSVAIVITELSHTAAEVGRTETYRAARFDGQKWIQQLAALDPIPREEHLCRQRFEELLAYGLVADYFLQEDVYRGTRVLLSLATGAAPGRNAQICLGGARVGALARTVGRYGLAMRIAGLLTDAGVNWELISKFAQSETMAARLSALSQLAGNVFGDDPVGSVVAFCEWGERVGSAGPPAGPAAAS